MILYHTSGSEIREPDIHYGRKNADFGWGFYLTPDMEFARRWAGENAVMNEYELDESGLSIHVFKRDIAWSRYILNNRRVIDDLKVDVVIGPIANDTLFDTLGILGSGFLKQEDVIRLLMIGPEYTQIAIKSEKAARQLRWIRSGRIERIDKEALKAEQDLYQEAFAQELGKIL